MLKLSPRAVEAAARARWPYFDSMPKMSQERALSEAERILTAALAVDGLRLVPVEPTEAMIKSGQSAIPGGHGQAWLYAAGAYRAMLSAASDGKERR